MKILTRGKLIKFLSLATTLVLWGTACFRQVDRIEGMEQQIEAIPAESKLDDVVEQLGAPFYMHKSEINGQEMVECHYFLGDDALTSSAPRDRKIVGYNLIFIDGILVSKGKIIAH